MTLVDLNTHPFLHGLAVMALFLCNLPTELI
jgi:hypothetical protein